MAQPERGSPLYPSGWAVRVAVPSGELKKTVDPGAARGRS